MPTTDPIGPLSPAASLAPSRSATGASSPADGTKDASQPSRGFLSSLRRAQRSGPDSSSRPVEAPHADVIDEVSPEAEAPPPLAPQAIDDSAPAPPPDAAMPDVAVAVFEAPTVTGEPAAQALQVAAEAAAVTVIATALPVVSDRPVPATAELPAEQETTASPIPQTTVPTAGQGAPTIPSALQEWLSAKPALTVRAAASIPAADDRSEAKPVVDSPPVDASTIPAGLQLALSAVAAAQGAAQPVLAAKASAAVPGVQRPASQLPVVSPTIVASAKAIPGTESQPALQSSAPPPFAAIELPAAGNATTVPAVPAALAAAAAPATSVKPQVATIEDDAPPVAAEQELMTAPVMSPLAIVIPAAVHISGGTTTNGKAVDQPAPAATAVGSIAAPVEVAAPVMHASVTQSAMPEADSQATAGPSADAAADAPSGTKSSGVSPTSTSLEPARLAAAADAKAAVPEPAIADVGVRESSIGSVGGRNDLGPLVSDRAGTGTLVPQSAPVVQVAPHDSQGLVDHVTQLVLESHSSGQQLSLQITPPDLGTVRIEVHSHGGILTARLEADSPAARQLLTEHLPQLREALQQQGANLDRIDVYQSDRSTQGEGMADSNWQSSQQDRQPDAAPLLYDDEEATETDGAETRGSLALGELNIRV